MSKLDTLKEAVSGDLDGLLTKGENTTDGDSAAAAAAAAAAVGTDTSGVDKVNKVEGDTAGAEDIDKKMGGKDKTDKEMMDDKNKKKDKMKKAADMTEDEKFELLAEGVNSTLELVKGLVGQVTTLKGELNSVNEKADSALEKADNTVVSTTAIDDLNTTLRGNGADAIQKNSKEELWKGVLTGITGEDRNMQI